MAVARLLSIVVVALGIGMRALGLGWGIPPPLAPDSTPVRSSDHLDEESFLRGAARIDPAARSFDPGDLHWGTLQFYLIWGALETAQRAGFVGAPWKGAFQDWDPEGFPRVYAAGRAVSAAAGILTLGVVFLIGRRLRDADAGLAAAAIVAVSPLHVVGSHFLTPDVTMTLLAAAALYCYVAALDDGKTLPLVAGGFFLGLAVAAKYNAAFLAPLWPARDLFDRRHSRGARLAGYAAAAAGFALGEPYALLRPRDFVQALRGAHFAANETAQRYLPGWGELVAEQMRSLATYGFYWSAAAAGAVGLALWIARPSRKSTALAAAALLAAVSLVFARWPLVRYTMLLVPIVALAAATALARIPARGWRVAASVAVLAPPLLFSAAQVRILRGPHPATEARRWIEANVPAGGRIGQIWPHLPPLDRRRYDVHVLHPFAHERPDAQDVHPQFLVLDELPIAPFSPAFEDQLRRYAVVAEFTLEPRLGPLRLPEPHRPHDWKYTHPRVRIAAAR